ncbi:MAG: UDP-3-O-(3-hydroxymyristoyl)glucosamine N-acyltransferase [Deltaproteobacteria bacterium]|nr:UDP-3-O-(3-hydroxymyristoyl)glucosamine N-acyltransferase [Deltaproteobacteria bacterium]
MKVSLATIGDLVGGEVSGDSTKTIHAVAPFEHAETDDITFAASAKYLKRINETRAGAVIVPKDFQTPSINVVQVDNPQVAFARVMNFFHPPAKPRIGISPVAYIGNNFKCGDEISIAPHVVIQDNVALGHRVTLHPGAVIGNDVVIGDDVEIHPNVTILERCRIGNRVVINAGTVIGSEGFGFAPDGETYYKIPQIGIVQIDDDVEIGAGNTIDRATFGKTWIKRGVKTDNLVQIAHNVTVGENTILVSQVGISGSCTIGKHAVLAGQAGIAGHLTIGDNAIVGPQAGIGKSVPAGEIVSGSPGLPHRLWLRVQNVVSKLPEMKKRISEIEKRLNKIEGPDGEDG